MHPVLADRRSLALHLAVWVLAGVMTALLTRTVLGTPWIASLVFGIPAGLVGGPIALSAWYVTGAAPAAPTGVIRPMLTAIVSAVVAAALWAIAAQGWWQAANWMGAGLGDASRLGLYPLLLGVGTLGYLLAVAAYQVVHTLDTATEARRRTLESEVAQRDAELRALRAQLDPHFLFNSLNSISGLIAVDPDRAREMCQRLADFLRESLRVGAIASIPLEREVALAEQYLRVEQVRFGQRLAVHVALAPDTAMVAVPPLILQPLVENAVRHGVATRLEGGAVRIDTRRAGERIVITVTNPRDADAVRRGTGFGLPIVERRLLATFGNGAALTIDPEPGSFRVSMVLPAGETR